MTKLIVAVVLATVIASPALGQSAAERRAQQAQEALSRSQAYGQAETTGRAETRRPAANPKAVDPNAVYDGSQYLGADPDPNIRLNLRMDYEHRDF